MASDISPERWWPCTPRQSAAQGARADVFAGRTEYPAGILRMAGPCSHASGPRKIEAKLGVKRHGAVVKRRLNQTNAGEAFPGCALHHGGHQPAARAPVLCRRIDGDGPYAGNRAAFVEAVAANDFAVLLSHHAEKLG